MKCPKCQAEVKNNAKFCTKCGCNLAVEAEKAAVKAPVQNAQTLCAKCGAPLKAGAKFCVKCGTPTAPVQNTPPAENTAPRQTTPPVQAAPPVTAPVENTAPRQTVPPAPTAPVQNTAPASNENEKKQKKKGKGAVIAIVIVLILLIAAASVGFLIWNGTISLPAMDFLESGDEDEDEQTEESEDETETKSETAGVPHAADADADTLFAEEDALLAEGKSQIAVDAEIVEGMEKLRDVIDQYVQKAKEAGDADLAADRIADAYTSYVLAVIKHKDMMDGQSISGSIYSQIMSEMKEAEKLADDLAQDGYTVDSASLSSAKEAFETSYTSRIIAEFDAFTTREAWSRTESWNLMSGFESMFDNSDLDNPLKLRYAYALSWWVQKQIETELANGTITEKGAAIKIANMIQDMDYNPMMLNYYITYMNHSGEDCTAVSLAYDEIVRHIGETQGIWIGKDVDLAHFWYFNDFGEYSVDDTNGVTPENRQWIRDRMSSVEFAQ